MFAENEIRIFVLAQFIRYAFARPNRVRERSINQSKKGNVIADAALLRKTSLHNPVAVVMHDSAEHKF